MSSAFELIDRLQFVEEELAATGSESIASMRAAERYGVARETARRWVAEVRRRWADDRRAVPKEERRAHLIAMVERVYASAMGQTLVLTDDEGNPRTQAVLDAEGKQVLMPDGKPMMRVMEISRPNRKEALAAVNVLIELEGLGSTNKHEVTVKSELITGTVAELAAAAAADNAALQRGMQQLLPEGGAVIDVEAVDARDGN